MTPAATVISPVRDRSMVRRAWMLTGLLWVALCLNFADRQVVFSLFPVLRTELGFRETQLGLTGSLFLWVYALCSPIAGRIGDRFSKRLLIWLSLALWSGATLFTAFVQSPGPLLAGRASIGLTEALFYPAAVALIATVHDVGTRSRALAVFNSAAVVGVMVGGSFGGYAAQYWHWRWAFLGLGAAGLLYALPFGAFLRRTPEQKPPAAQQAGGVGLLLRRPALYILAMIYSAAAFTTYLLYTWLATFLTEKFALGLAEAGATATVYAKTAAWAGLGIGGWMADWLYRRYPTARFLVLGSAVLLTGPSVLLVAYAPTLIWTKVGAVAFGLCNGAYQANLFASAFEVVEPERRALAVGLLNLVGASVSGFAGWGGGMWRETHGLASLMAWSALSCVAAGALLLVALRWLPHTQPQSEVLRQ